MKRVLGYLLTPFFYLYYAVILIGLHPVQVAVHRIFGDKARRKVVDFLNLSLVKGFLILGCKIKYAGNEKIPENRPLIVVSNHQSMHDIPAIGHVFKKFYPKFISKIELSKYYPSISYNLKHGKSALIDRKKGTQAVKEIFKLGRLIEENNYAACIFPEGTRSNSGIVKNFMTAGISTLYRAAPSAVIVPFIINGHSQFMEKGLFPLKFGQRITYTVLDPVEPKGQPMDEIVSRIEDSIKRALDQDTIS